MARSTQSDEDMRAEAEFKNTLNEIGMVAEVAVDQVRMGGLFPTATQWARAQALREARGWLGPDVTDTARVEALAMRWAHLILTGDTQGYPS